MIVMDFTNLHSWMENLSLEKIFSGNLDGFIPMFYLMISIAIYSIIIYHFYRYIARRDCFKPSKKKHTKAISFLKFFFLYPFVAILFFMGFSLMMIFLTKSYSVQQIITTAFAIVLAIRVCAYYTEDLSRDVAKMLPFALLGVFLVDPSYFTLELVKCRINELPTYVNAIIQYIFFMMIIEWILRITLIIKRVIIPPKKEEPVTVETQQ